MLFRFGASRCILTSFTLALMYGLLLCCSHGLRFYGKLGRVQPVSQAYYESEQLFFCGDLANTYKGGIRDHYAIMADVSEAESDYWRRNYGIHLISYATTERPDKTKDHSALLTLLDTLLQHSPTPSGLAIFDQRAPDVVLALARYAAGLARNPKKNPEFQIRVHAHDEYSWEYGKYIKPDKFHHYPVEKFLVDGPERALLIGLPGAGKTYSLRRAAAQLAEQLHESCLSESFDAKSVILPIYADLKLYRGNLLDLVSSEPTAHAWRQKALQNRQISLGKKCVKTARYGG